MAASSAGAGELALGLDRARVYRALAQVFRLPGAGSLDDVAQLVVAEAVREADPRLRGDVREERSGCGFLRTDETHGNEQ